MELKYGLSLVQPFRTNLLIKESPENGEGQEHVGDRLERLHVLDERAAVLLLGVVQDRLLLLGLPAFRSLLEGVLHREQTGLSVLVLILCQLASADDSQGTI